ncbi:class I adenylate-forming enzyme family protein [Cryptosporangium aurantiacum]|uniref:Acyl-CoA synthetase (AMP-forming)/AMP-acid ligase II n=1 Tax=Cryptosporangium aurantiacum TaxID=134849 RepID=A0A1M7R4A8_9ACTN|nr:AMP-binding protein [Cryptosporangium aurantiacum]SHN39819.1 Acyl-CoA synthetase (AMP-forming)/AMP-acid ligase II [Cryptosporangium aurantiacum]
MIQQRLGSLLKRAPARAAVVYGETAWTWTQLAALSEKLNRLLNMVALGDGARIGVALENRPQSGAVVAALLATDRCLTALNPLRGPERLCADIEANALPVVVASSHVLALPGVRRAIARHGRTIVVDWDGTCEMESVEPVLVTDRSTAPGVAVETLTVGGRKQVLLTYQQLATAFRSAGARGRAGDAGTVAHETGATIVSTPIAQIGGLVSLVASMYAGRRTVLLDGFLVDEWVHAVERYRPYAAELTPGAMRALVEANASAHRLASLQVITCGTDPCPPQLADALFSRYGIRVVLTYGAVEFSGAVAGWTRADHVRWWIRKQGAAGRALPGVALRVVGRGGVELPAGTSGVLEIRSAREADAGRQWVRTSDLARLDEDGFLWIEGRTDDAMIGAFA